MEGIGKGKVRGLNFVTSILLQLLVNYICRLQLVAGTGFEPMTSGL